MTQAPSVGRIVHYTSHGTPGGEYSKECRAAIITAVHDQDPVPEDGVPYVDLCVFNTGVFFKQDCRHEEIDDKIEPGPAGRTGGTWHWPERV